MTAANRVGRGPRLLEMLSSSSRRQSQRFPVVLLHCSFNSGADDHFGGVGGIGDFDVEEFAFLLRDLRENVPLTELFGVGLANTDSNAEEVL